MIYIKAIVVLFIFTQKAWCLSSPEAWRNFSLREYAWQQFKGSDELMEVPAVSAEEFKKIQRLVWTRHRVKNSDNIWKLAMNYGTSVESIQSTNGGEMIWMKPGSQIIVLNKRGTLHRVRAKNGQGETLSDVVRFYKSRNHGLQQKLREEIVKANNLPGYALLTEFELAPGALMFVPGTYLEFDTFRIPFKSSYWPGHASGYGLRYHPILKIKRFHEGLDFAQPSHTPVFPSRSGRVIFAGWRGGYGLLVIIKHTDGATTRYGHLSKIVVKEGQWVERGKTLIGRVGSTGLSTGPHLHFEIRDRFGRPLNPKKKIGKK